MVSATGCSLQDTSTRPCYHARALLVSKQVGIFVQAYMVLDELTFIAFFEYLLGLKLRFSVALFL